MDALLVFPPQWSPFQPPLGLPSLSAWLRRAGFQVTSLDLNLSFYQWLLSDDCARLLSSLVPAATADPDTAAAHLAVFDSVASFRRDIRGLTAAPANEAPSDLVLREYLAIRSFGTYLRAVSAVAGSFQISPYGFSLAADGLRASVLERQVAEPSPLVSRFVEDAVDNQIRGWDPPVVGLSCIGQEQLYLTLLLGYRIKRALDATVVVGGTILSRILDRGSLPPHWFGRYFDVVVCHEGERPMQRLVGNVLRGRPAAEGVPGAVLGRDGVLSLAPPAAPLRVPELPVPDFSDLPLDRYLCGEVTLPLLASRGCYWGQCEFCHHGVVYGERYGAHRPAAILDTLSTLSTRHGVLRFCFNDEALPPTSVRRLARVLPPHDDSGWTFTGLLRFEESYTPEDFVGLHRIGFRSLYVGLESASERVLDLMRKRTSHRAMVANLSSATEAGLWTHCFLFFGFPGETEQDAQSTYDFVLNNVEIISSFGAGTFALEHNAPIFHHPADFGVVLCPVPGDDLDVYYDYEVDHGIGPARASEWMNRLNASAGQIPGYAATSWVPREILLLLLSRMAPGRLREIGSRIRQGNGGTPTLPIRRVLSVLSSTTPTDRPAARTVVNRGNGRVVRLTGPAAEVFDLCYADDVALGVIHRAAPLLGRALGVAR